MRECLLLAAAAAAAGCATSGAVPRPFPAPGGPPPATTPAGRAAPDRVTGNGYAIAGTALSLRGAPYRDGGADPSGFDCSGFVQYVFARHGVAMPREVRDQYRAGRSVSIDRLEPGDLLFFTTQSPGASHVAIAVDQDQFVHAPSSRGEVRVERLSGGYWSARYLGARRLTR